MCKDLAAIFGPADLDVFKCGDSLQYGVRADAPLFLDGSNKNANIFFDVLNFNDVSAGLISIFVTLTLEGWSTLMYNYMDSQIEYISMFFFVFLVIFGSFFSLNLVLATIIDSFDKVNTKNAQSIDIEDLDDMLAEKKKQLANEKKPLLLRDVLTEAPATARTRNSDLLINATSVQPQDSERIHSKPLIYVGSLEAESEQRRTELIQETLESQRNLVTDLQTVPSSSIFESLGPAEEADTKNTKRCCDWDESAEQRSQRNLIYLGFYRLVCHWAFNFLVFLLILANTFALALYTYDMSDRRERILTNLNVFFTWAFAAEMVFKLIGLGPVNYRRELFNLFDASIVIVSLVEWAVQVSS